MKIPPHLEGLSKRDLIRQNIILEARVLELERRLLAYENAHTPPSQQRNYPKREKNEGAKPGAPSGHQGATRKTLEPTESKTLSLSSCPDCGNSLGKPKRIQRKIIEELPDPQPLRVIEFFVPHYRCQNCGREVRAADPELPKQGNMGNNLQAQIALMKYEDRIPYRKIANVLNRQYGLKLTPAAILDVLGRAADSLAPAYETIRREIPKSPALNADETGAKLNGKKHWFWVFMSRTLVLFLLRKKRDSNVVREVIGENYEGVLTCDGLKAYGMIVKKIQRCWAHLLREAKFLAQKHGWQAGVLYRSLCGLFAEIKKAAAKTPMAIREKLYKNCIKKMRFLADAAKVHKELRKFAATIKNGMGQWFTCVLHPEIEPTNNRAERELREFVVQRKIFGTFRSEKGIKTAGILLSVLATWRLRGFNTYSMLRQALSS